MENGEETEIVEIRGRESRHCRCWGEIVGSVDVRWGKRVEKQVENREY